MKAYGKIGITNINSDLCYDRTKIHKATIDIVFTHNGEGFDAVGAAYNELIEDIHNFFKQSYQRDDLPTRLEGSE